MHRCALPCKLIIDNYVYHHSHAVENFVPHYEYIDPSIIIGKSGPYPQGTENKHIPEVDVNVEHVYEIIRGPEAIDLMM